MKLKDKVAVVTGSGRGLGRAAALAMAQEGAKVVVLSRTASEIAETEQLIQMEGREALSFVADIADCAEIERIVGETLAVFGRIDILMNNAAVIGPICRISEAPDEEWRRTMAVNLDAAFSFSRAVLPGMMKRRAGKIINVTSGLAEMVLPPFGAYSVSKAALNHFTRILADEVRQHNIQVFGLDPGIMDTRMQEQIRGMGPEVLGSEIYNEFVSFKEKGYLSPPEREAGLAVFLASASSKDLTGEIGTINHFTKLGYFPNSTDFH